MYKNYNPNPSGKNVGDCTVRAISKAFGYEWWHTYLLLCAFGLKMHDMPSANTVWGAFLRKSGFTRHLIDDHGQEDYTVRDFCEDFPHGIFILAISGHVVCVIDGNYYDTWDSGDEIPIYYWQREDSDAD